MFDDNGISTYPGRVLEQLGIDVALILGDAARSEITPRPSHMEQKVALINGVHQHLDHYYYDDKALFQRIHNLNQHVGTGTFGPLIDSLIYCNSGLDGLSIMESIQYLFVDDRFCIQESQRVISVIWPANHQNGKSELFGWAKLAFIQMLIERMYPQDIPTPIKVCAPCIPKYPDIVQQTYQCAINIGSRFELHYPRELLLAPLRTQNKTFKTFIYQQYIHKSPISSQDKLATIKATLKCLLKEGNASLERLAECFFVTPRTLQRQLKELDCTFADIYQQEREMLAKKLLAETHLSSLDIALKLGFKESTTFSRAFKTWTSLTPMAYRKMMQKA